MIYPDNKQTFLSNGLLALVAAVALPGCGWINPNFQTILTPNAASYQIEGSVTRGFASHPKVAYVEAEGDNPDEGSFHKDGDPTSGIDSRGIYIPSGMIGFGTDGRFKTTFTGPSRYVLIHVFAWDDVNNNGIRDVGESLAGDYELKKVDLNGWKFNASDWNQFNFTFTQ